MASKFPQTGDEDVEIHLTTDTEDKIKIHSYVLALHSKWFKASLSERWNGGNTATAGGKNHFIYELRFDKDDGLGLLARQAQSSTTADSTTEMISRVLPADATSAAKKLHKQRLPRVNAHRRMLEAMYHVAPNFPTGFHDAKDSILQLSQVAEVYDCQLVVKIYIENHLNVSRDQVLAECAKDPPRMLELAMAVQCSWIFIEAATYVIGANQLEFNKYTPMLRSTKAWGLLQKKRTEFQNALMACEMELFQIQPSSFRGSQGQQMAVDFFRQWLSWRLATMGLGSKLENSYASVYREISTRPKDSATSCGAGEVKNFLARCHSSANKSDMANDLNAVFARAAHIVEPILKDVTKPREKSDSRTRNLTFMSISEEEIPWNRKK